jgi:hypothetical protein
LSRVHLKVRRPRDLLYLSYRFQDLVLERDGPEWDKAHEADAELASWWILPDRRLGAFAAYRLQEPQPAPPDLLQKATDEPPQRYAAARDPQPLMVVQFPPQHIAEQAFFRQFVADPALPEPTKDTAVMVTEAEALRKAADPDARRTIKDAIAGRQVGADPQKFAPFVNAFAKGAKDLNLPVDQQVYVGSAYLDPPARRVARRVARSQPWDPNPAGVGQPDNQVGDNVTPADPAPIA